MEKEEKILSREEILALSERYDELSVYLPYTYIPPRIAGYHLNPEDKSIKPYSEGEAYSPIHVLKMLRDLDYKGKTDEASRQNARVAAILGSRALKEVYVLSSPDFSEESRRSVTRAVRSMHQNIHLAIGDVHPDSRIHPTLQEIDSTLGLMPAPPKPRSIPGKGKRIGKHGGRIRGKRRRK